VFAGAFIAALLSINAMAQQVAMERFKVGQSSLIEQIKALKAAEPKQTLADFVKAANDLLDKNGINFQLSLDAVTCEKIRQLKQEDPSKAISLSASLKSIDAEQVSLSLPSPNVAAPECGGCFVELPLLEITDRTFVTVLRGRNIKFGLPNGVQTNEAVLLDAKDPTKVKRTWKIPFRAVPIGISYDENVLYLGFDEPELSQLSLLVFGQGVFQIGTREEAEDGGAGKRSEMSPGSLEQQIRFERWKNIYIIKFKKACAH
jgi:hypothetical protein